MIPTNINEIINELRSLYDDLKQQKSQLNRKIRTLNNAYSRKNRKINEADAYSDKSEGIKNSLITSTRDTFNDITSSKRSLEANVNQIKRRIQELSVAADMLRNDGNLTLSQNATVELFNNFSDQISDYFDANINELKSYKYDNIKSFLEVELANTGEILFSESDFYINVLSPATFIFEKMLEKAHELKELDGAFKYETGLYNANIRGRVDGLDALYGKRNMLDSQILLKEQELSNVNDQLQAANQEGASQEVIDELLFQKTLAEQKVSETQDLRQQLMDDIDQNVKALADFEQTRDGYVQDNTAIRNSMCTQLDSLKMSFVDAFGKIVSEKDKFEFITGGKKFSLELFMALLQQISNNLYNAFGDKINNVRDLVSGFSSDNLNTSWQKGLFSNVIDGQNSVLIEGKPSLKTITLANSEWMNRGSFALDDQIHISIKNYLDQIRQLSIRKLGAEYFSQLTPDLRQKLDTLYDTKGQLQNEIDMISTSIIEYGEAIESKQAENDAILDSMNSLDPNIPTYIGDWWSLETERLTVRQDIFSLEKSIDNNLVAKDRIVDRINVIDEKIQDLETKFSAFDNMIGENLSVARNLENEIKSNIESWFNPETGEIINHYAVFGRREGVYDNVYGALDSVKPYVFEIRNNFRIAVIDEWPSFINSDFGYLMILLHNNGYGSNGEPQTSADDVLSQVEWFLNLFGWD